MAAPSIRRPDKGPQGPQPGPLTSALDQVMGPVAQQQPNNGPLANALNQWSVQDALNRWSIQGKLGTQ